ncbi:hypothetical protein SAMN05421830_11668 [Desulfomicrobium norvegicum]|uniref:Uncharacterized protein n=1 Tax=Desulfomicrobium norvegicum (strain DSM 1741 / NCIMB 8310) TaxID=52561 RepID=A0A8G2C5S5_DESNO|nr:hypothetical protein SAMN05421830_11668 [Desulfomicrobium norvegicum]
MSNLKYYQILHEFMNVKVNAGTVLLCPSVKMRNLIMGRKVFEQC